MVGAMTFEDLDQELPNGFHDAKIRNISVDFLNRSVLIGVELLVGLPDTPNPEDYRAGTLKLIEPCMFFVEPPDPAYPFVPRGRPVNVDGDPVRAGQSVAVDRLLPVLPQNACVYRFFLEEWNSFLYLAGASVEFSWDDGGLFEPVNSGSAGGHSG
jgi:hypothetical protein